MKNKNLIWGLFFILAGVALILDRTGLLGSVSVWSVVISLLLVPVIVTSVRHLNFWGIFFPMAIMAILFDETLGIEKFTPWHVWVRHCFSAWDFHLFSLTATGLHKASGPPTLPIILHGINPQTTGNMCVSTQNFQAAQNI